MYNQVGVPLPSSITIQLCQSRPRSMAINKNWARMTWYRLGCGRRHRFRSTQHKDKSCWINWSNKAFLKCRLVLSSL